MLLLPGFTIGSLNRHQVTTKGFYRIS